MEKFNCNGLQNNTVDQINDFLTGLEDIRSQATPQVIFEYIQNGNKIHGINPNIFSKLDNLKKCEVQAIKNELPFIKLQAEDAGLEVPQIVKKIENFSSTQEQLSQLTLPAIIGFSPKTLEYIPSLKVFTPFMWISERDLQLLNSQNSQKTNFDDGDDPR